MNIKEQIVFRKFQESDREFVFNSWLRSYRGSRFVRCLLLDMDKETYYEEQHVLIEQLLDRETMVSCVVCNPEDHTHIYGYGFGEQVGGQYGTVVHWMYLKKPFRGYGIATELLKKLVEGQQTVHYTHHQPGVQDFFRKVCKGIYNPFLFWR